jgi:tetratricopeptide (TPR) repeat protein
MRARNKRKHRQPLPVDGRKFYSQELGLLLLQPLDWVAPQEADFEVAFCEQILRGAPDHVEALALLGEAYTRRGDYAKGLETDLRLCRIRPESSVVHYNLACSYALTGKKEEALLALGRAVDLGYRDVVRIRDDRDLEILRSDPRYQDLIRKLGAEEARTEKH